MAGRAGEGKQPFLYSLREKGFTVTLSEDGSKFSIKPGANITPHLKKMLDTHREGILDELKDERNANKQTHKWILLLSSVVEDRVLVLLDPGVAVPEKYEGTVYYTLDEIRLLKGKDPEHIRIVHEIKSIMKGEISE
jgi:hypothetical protein